MRPGIDSPPEIKAQALALYAETFSSVEASKRLLEETGEQVHHATIRTWSQAVDGFTQRLRNEQKQRLSDNWFTVAAQGSERMIDVIKDLPPNQVAVPAAIATDKYLKLTEENVGSGRPAVTVIIGVVPTDTVTVTDVTGD